MDVRGTVKEAAEKDTFERGVGILVLLKETPRVPVTSGSESSAEGKTVL